MWQENLILMNSCMNYVQRTWTLLNSTTIVKSNQIKLVNWMPSFLHNSLGSDDIPVAKWLSCWQRFMVPLIKDLTSGHSRSTYLKHSIQCHTYSYSQNFWTFDVPQMWLLGSAAILLIGSNSLLMTRSQSGSRFPEDSHKALASVPFCWISMSENSHRNVFLIHFNLLMILLNSTQRASMDAGVKTPQCPHLSSHYFISII